MCTERDAKSTFHARPTLTTPKFHPNGKFKTLFLNEWEETFHEYEDPKSYELSTGMYGLCLGVGYSSGLYPCPIQAYDGMYSAGILDYCMYSLLGRNDVTQLYEERMREEVLFSEKVWSAGQIPR